MTRVATFDCGTNSLRLLIADLDPVAGTTTELVREMRVVRLGQGVDRTGRISDEAMTRVFAATEEYMESVREHAPERIRFCATSAARDADNSAEFMEGIRSRVGVTPEVLDGAAEAAASYDGATRGLPEVPAPLLVIDIGGGSTELVLGDEAGRILQSDSLNIGSVRLTERHLADDPPTPEQIEQVRADVRAALAATDVDLSRTGTAIGVAGTITTVAAACMRLERYQRELIHRSTIQTDAIRGVVDELLSMSVEERRALGFMHPGRADVIGAGGLILVEVLRLAGVSSLVVSEQDILDGIAWSVVDQEK